MRIIPKLSLALGVALVLLFAGLLATPSALAHGAGDGEAAGTSEQVAPGGSEAESSSEPAPGPEEPPAESTPPPVEETPPAPPAEETPPAPPAEETPPPPPAETPPAEESHSQPAENLAETPIEVSEPEKKAAAKASPEGTVNAQIPGQLPAGTSTAPEGTAATDPVLETQSEVSTLPDARTTGRGHRKSSAGAGCATTSLAAPITSNCAEGWLSVPAGSPASNAPVFVSATHAMSAIEGAGPGPRHHRDPVENAPSMPRPEAPPGGSGGLSAAAGGSCSACSALTSAGPILQITQIATRQLLVEQPSWRTPFFVLIPERPG